MYRSIYVCIYMVLRAVGEAAAAVRVAHWPLQYIAIVNIVLCMTHTRGVG